MAQKIGGIARTAYEKTQMTLGMAMAGVRPEAAPAAPADTADQPKPSLASRLTNANFLRVSTLGVTLSAVAITALAKHHGAETGGQAIQPVADTIPMAVPKVEHEGALKWGLVGAVAVIVSPVPLLWVKDKISQMRLNRAEGARLTQPQPPMKDPATGKMIYQPPALDRIRYAAEDAEERRLAEIGQRVSGYPLHLHAPTIKADRAAGIDIYPPGYITTNKLMRYHPVDTRRLVPTPPPSSGKLWKYFGGRQHFDY
jgi:hypothetical protein